MRCAIAILDPSTGTGRAIYCHNEGQPETTGTILQAHYTTAEKTRDLINLGSISWLGNETRGPDLSHCPEQADPWQYILENTRAEELTSFTFAYHRDRGLEWEYCIPVSFDAANTGELPQAIDWWHQFGAHYIYCWTPDGWHCSQRDPTTGQYSTTPIPAPTDP